MSKLDLKSPALRHRRTKIVATLGPATSSPAAISELLQAGVNVVRLNFSHGTTESHEVLCKRVRAAATKLDQHVAILGDLSGPKMRTGRFDGGSIELTKGETVVVTARSVTGSPGVIPVQYKKLPQDVKPGEALLLDDGHFCLEVVAVRGTEVTCMVIDGGRLKDHKGINLPGSATSAPALTAKDRRDAAAAVAMQLDYLALSFVRRASDVRELKRLLLRLGRAIPVIAKIEKPQALANIEEIVETADGIMVARGDLGVELPPQRVPIAQRELIRLAIERDRPVIVATQMLESMIENPRPTRAEVNDVAGAAFSSADAVMLSAETASGKNPIAAVQMMDRILREVEGHLWREGDFEPGRRAANDDDDGALRVRAAIGRAAAQLSWDLKVRCIMVPSRSGASARAVSADRPEAPVVLISADAEVCRRGALFWGVLPHHEPNMQSTGLVAIEGIARRLATELGVGGRGDRILLVRGFDRDPVKSLPTVTVLTL